MDLAPGASLTDTLRLVRPLGTHGKGDLWIGADALLGQEVAIKLLSRARLQSGKGALERFQRGAQAAAQLASPHVVRVFTYGRTGGGLPYIVMELLQGETLSERLDRAGRLNSSDTVHLVSQLASALDELHALDLVHCDLGPSNVLLAEPQQPPVVKLLDFDSVEPFHQGGANGATGAPNGEEDPLYLSPEQIADSEPIDHRADLWALGVIAYRSLVGSVPFSAATTQALRQEIYAARITLASEWRPEVPPAVDAWFARALARRANDRFDSARAMADALAEALAASQDLFPDDGIQPAATAALGMQAELAGAAPAFDPQATVMLPDGAGAELPPLGGDDADEPLATAMLPEDLQPDRSALGGDDAYEPAQTSVLAEEFSPMAKPAATPADDAATVELNRRADPAFQALDARLAARDRAAAQPAAQPWEILPPRRSPWAYLVGALVVALAAAIIVLLL